MNKDFSDLPQAFLALIKEEEHSSSLGLPKMRRLNESVDLQFLRFKLRLQVRMLLYTRYAGDAGSDLSEVDFLEVQTLLERRPDLLGVCPVVNAFWKQVQLLRDGQKHVALHSAQHLVTYYYDYESMFSQGEARDFIEGVSGFANRLINEGRSDFSRFGFLMGLRVIELRFRGKKKVHPEEYLSGSLYFNVAITGLTQMEFYDISELLDITDFGHRSRIKTTRDWFEGFANDYYKYLEPEGRKMQRNYLRASIFFHYEDYVAALKIFVTLSIPNHDIANIIIKRCLFCVAYSIIYHGTPTERRMVRRRNLSLDLQIDRMRKHLEYLRKERPVLKKRLVIIFEEHGQLKKLLALRRMADKGVMSVKVKEQYLRQKALLDPQKFKAAFSTRKWFENELLALP